jgi:hypothetical protein
MIGYDVLQDAKEYVRQAASIYLKNLVHYRWMLGQKPATQRVELPFIVDIAGLMDDVRPRILTSRILCTTEMLSHHCGTRMQVLGGAYISSACIFVYVCARVHNILCI